MLIAPRPGRSRVVATLLLALAIFAAGLALWSRPTPAEPTSPSGPVKVLRMLDEHVASQTLKDWKAAADAVVVGHVTAESAIQQGPEPSGRTVTFSVDDLLWRDHYSNDVPAGSIRLSAAGWAREGKLVHELSGAGSRLEVGHTYVLALVHERPLCSRGRVVQDARWSRIGSGGALPADHGVIGRGEYEGTVVRRATTEGLAADSVLRLTRGKSPQDLQDHLEQAPWTRRVAFQDADRLCS